MTPIYLEPIVVAAEVIRAEADILREEGAFTVRGIYFADARDANTARRVEAERRVEQYARQMRLSMACPWCGTPVKSVGAIEIGGRNLHPACATEFDRDAYGNGSDELQQREREQAEVVRAMHFCAAFHAHCTEYGSLVDEEKAS